MSYKDVHLLVYTIVQKEIVTHPDSMRLHGMSRTVIKISDFSCRTKYETVQSHSRQIQPSRTNSMHINNRTCFLIKTITTKDRNKYTIYRVFLSAISGGHRTIVKVSYPSLPWRAKHRPRKKHGWPPPPTVAEQFMGWLKADFDNLNCGKAAIIDYAECNEISKACYWVRFFLTQTSRAL